MKVALNGGLSLSVLDGWWAEAYDGTYLRDADGIPVGWVQGSKASMRRPIPQFTAERMLREYAATRAHRMRERLKRPSVETPEPAALPHQ